MGKIKKTDLGSRIAALLFVGLIAYLPFHIFISTVVGVNLGGLEAFKAGKDIVILLIGIFLIPYALTHKPEVKEVVFAKWLGILCLSFIFINLLFFIMDNRDLDSSALGLIYNTRYIAAFLLAGILAKAQPGLVNTRILVKTVVLTSLLVAIVGILQYFFLPKDFFERLGYSMQNGVLPWFYIDDKPDFPRIMSTMRDPNSLGSYLLIPISLLAAKILVDFKDLSTRMKAKYGLAIVILVLALLLAFSRSAIIGLIFVMLNVSILANQDKIKRNLKFVVAAGLAGLVVLSALGLLLMNTNPRFFKNVVFHADEETSLRDPNELRVDFLKKSLDDIAENPFGNGLGSAGLASMKNEVQGVNLTENYYLQLGVEIGIIGLIIFLAASFLIVQALYGRWRKESSYIPLALIASFVGLFITNNLAHIWTNETIAVTWWGLAAVFIYQAGSTNKGTVRKKHPSKKSVV